MIDIKDIKLACSPFTRIVYAGKLNKEKTMWLQKKDVTKDFYDCVIDYFEGKTEIIENNNNEAWEVTVKKIK